MFWKQIHLFNFAFSPKLEVLCSFTVVSNDVQTSRVTSNKCVQKLDLRCNYFMFPRVKFISLSSAAVSPFPVIIVPLFQTEYRQVFLQLRGAFLFFHGSYLQTLAHQSPPSPVPGDWGKGPSHRDQFSTCQALRIAFGFGFSFCLRQ